jgi:predicted alpha/beta superfamily hydrolase
MSETHHTAGADPAPTRTGEFRTHERFRSRHLPDDHTVVVYLPPRYEEEPTRRYPVLYMQDGQNLFDEETAFGGSEWHVDETAQRLIAERRIAPLIVVGIWNAGESRIDEYTPTFDEAQEAGGKADLYARLLVEELKPHIDETYRTRTGAGDTGLGGSSLGGLVALHIGLTHSNVFGRLAIMSPAVWWDGRVIVREVLTLAERPPLRIWLDAGTGEGKDVVDDARLLRDALLAKGWRLGHDLHYVEAEGAGHDEAAWASRVPGVLEYLFPPESP